MSVLRRPWSCAEDLLHTPLARNRQRTVKDTRHLFAEVAGRYVADHMHRWDQMRATPAVREGRKARASLCMWAAF